MPRVVVFDEFGGPEVLHVVDEPVAEPTTGEARVRIVAAGVNPLDQMMRAGTSPAPVQLPHARLGVEGSGIVDAVGPGVTGLAAGDPVIIAAVPDASTRGSYADYTTVLARQLVARPAELDPVAAAAMWVGYSTAYGALVETAGMRPGDHVLVTAASGSVGRAAIQIANQLGAVPIALTRQAARKGELLAAGASLVIATDEDEVSGPVAEHTGGRGVDIVLDLVRGPGQQHLVDATRAGGTLVVAGFLDPRPTPFPSGPPLRIVTYRSFEHTLDPAALRRMVAFLAAGTRLGVLHPVIDTAFSLDDVVEAHRHLAAGRHNGGKIVLTT